MRVELLTTQECPHADRVEEILRRVLAEHGHSEGVDRVYVGDLDHAAGLGFRGSPTIRIDGRDVVPADGLSVNLGCRLYPQADGTLGGVVPAQTIEAELARRRAKEEEALAARKARPGLRDAPGRL